MKLFKILFIGSIVPLSGCAPLSGAFWGNSTEEGIKANLLDTPIKLKFNKAQTEVGPDE